MFKPNTLFRMILALPLAALLYSPLNIVRAADHRDAPAVDGLGEGDITDVFAFLDPNNPQRLVVAMGVNPLAVPALLHSYRFSTDYLYQFKIGLDLNSKEDFVIQVAFDNTDTGQNARIYLGKPDPNYIGAENRILPGDPYFSGPVGQVIGNTGPFDVQAFTGLRDDPFVLDGQFFRIINGTQEVFRDLPTTPVGALRGRRVRPDGTSAIDLFAGFNASFIVVSIPTAFVSGGSTSKISVWGTVSGRFEPTGTFVQFERMGQPLFNTVFIPGALKDAFNAGVPADDMARWSGFVPDSLTNTDNDGKGNTIAGRAALLTTLGLNRAPNGAPLLLPADFKNTNKDLLRVALLPDVLRLDLKLAPTDLGIGQFGLINGRRPGDAVVDIALRVLRQLADVNFPAALGVPGSGSARPGALTFPDRRVFAVLQGTMFIQPDNKLDVLNDSGNDSPLPTTFPFFAPPHPRPGDETPSM